ncbi:MAG: hypothetical protein HY079_13780 [Elusimicrobia bacterium]|nr:hypothetical protein [Elusimicrobiota bacterium]
MSDHGPDPIDPRLARPAPAPAPAAKAPPAKAAPPPAPPGAGELLESALAGLAGPAAFRALAARPAPSTATAGAFALSAGAASLAVGLAHAVVESPGLLGRFSPPMIAAVAVAALGLYGSVTLLLAVMLYGLGNALGGKGDFDRGLQAAAMMSVLWPAQMMCNWFPLAWVLPSALAAWLAANALEGLFAAKPWTARTVCAVLGAGALAMITIARVVGERAAESAAAAQAMTQAAASEADLARQLQTVAARMQALPDAGPPSGGPGTAARPATSGLDLLRGGEEGQAAAPEPAAPAAQAAQAVQAAQGAQTNASGMLDSLAPLLDNPAMSKNLTAAQKAEMQELQAVMADLRAQMASGHSLSNADYAKKMQRLQALTMAMMAAAAAQTAPAAPPTPAPEKKTPHLKLPEPGERR